MPFPLWIRLAIFPPEKHFFMVYLIYSVEGGALLGEKEKAWIWARIGRFFIMQGK